MSRLIIKNLPNAITAEKLKERFATKGVVTDIQLKYTSDGKFRHFGFIGFRCKEEADQAVDYFNNTYINQSKITVEHCTDLGDAAKPKSWSKYAPDSSAYKKLHSKEEKVQTKEEAQPDTKEKTKKDKINPEVVEKLKKHKDDPMFLEFLETHSKEDALKVIAEDRDSGVDEEEDNNEESEKPSEDAEEKKSSAFADISDLEYLKLKQKSAGRSKDDKKLTEDKETVSNVIVEDKTLFTVKIINLAFTTKKKEVKDFFRPLKPVGIRIPRNASGFAYVSFKTAKEMKKALNKNKSFLKGKQVGVKQYVCQEEKDGNQAIVGNEKQKRWKEQEEALMQEESIAESGSIFVRNLAYTITEENITELFSPYGPLADVTLPVDKVSRRVKGFATVTYVMPEHAVAAYSALDGTVYLGRMLHLLPAKTKKTAEDDDNENKSFKDKKREKEKASAGQSHNWNTLFLGQNAILDVMAEKYKTSKQDVLTGSDVAVRVALGETQIVSETRQFLLDNGVSLDAFNQAPKLRSKTVILIKNLPAKTTAAEIKEMFCKFGELGRVVLPPIGVTAIVEFLEPSEAKKAFLALAYTRFKNLPLYLEWAPDETFSHVIAKKEEVDEENKSSVKEDVEHEMKDVNESDEDDQVEPEPDTTLYVKNLNFDTTEESIKQHFAKCGRVASVTIARKKDPARPGEVLSMGYGFVQFSKQAELNQALKQLQHSSLDGHELELKRSNRTLQDSKSQPRKKNNVEKQTGTKILVRNIPFQATQKEVHQLFETFGEIKSLRLPKKMVGTGSHRGFAFVEFHTKHDAKRAMSALCQSTHFFGRRLVLEWAQEDEDVEQLRKRTAAGFKQASETRSKKARADLEIQDEEEDE